MLVEIHILDVFGSVLQKREDIKQILSSIVRRHPHFVILNLRDGPTKLARHSWAKVD